MDKVSVVIPTFNHAAYIRGAINSVLRQSYQHLEVIVIDDGSTDDTREVLEKFMQAKKISYVFQDNRGLSAARNTGLRLATGRYVKFLDSDDWLYPLQIEKQMEDLAAAQDARAMSMTNMSMMGPSGRTVDIDVPMVNPDRQLGHFFMHNRGGIHSYIFSKSMMEEIGGFDENLKACEDLDLKLRLILKGHYVRKVNYLGCCYRLAQNSMSNDTLHMFLQKCQVYEKANKALWDRQKDLPGYLIEPVLIKNVLLIDECIARRIPMPSILSNTIRLTALLYQMSKKGKVKLLYDTLGFTRYSFVRYFLKTLKDRQYRQRLLTQEISWKIK